MSNSRINERFKRKISYLLKNRGKCLSNPTRWQLFQYKTKLLQDDTIKQKEKQGEFYYVQNNAHKYVDFFHDIRYNKRRINFQNNEIYWINRKFIEHCYHRRWRLIFCG